MSMYEHTSKDKVACGNCGMGIPANCVYCPRCGAKRDSVEVSSGAAEPPVNKWFSQAGDLDGASTDTNTRTDGLAEAPFIKKKDATSAIDRNLRDIIPTANAGGAVEYHQDTVTNEESGFIPPYIPFAGGETESVPEKKTRYCTSCGKELKIGAKFCTSCGRPCATEEENKYKTVKPSRDTETSVPAPRYEKTGGSSKSISLLCVALLIGCLVLWVAGPFIALNLLTFGNQPTAFEIVTGDVLVIGDLHDTVAFWAAAVSIVGIAVCFVSEIASAHGITCLFATITEIPFVIAILDIFDWGIDMEYLLDIFGVGFWGILVMLFAVICVSAAKKLSEN